MILRNLVETKTLDEVEKLHEQNRISDKVYEGYCWLWRKCKFRYTEALEDEENKPCPTIALEIAKELKIEIKQGEA